MIYKNYIITKEGSIISKKTGKQIYVHVNKKGYNFVRLYDNGFSCTCLVHRMIAEMYVPNPDKLPEVNHKDGNKSNNNHWNLEWTTRKGNVDHAVANGLVPSGVNHYSSKLTQDQVDQMRGLHRQGWDCARIGRKLGVSQASAYRICHYQSHK
jgi:hypothetical protein